jgi:hypothetical protein
VSSIGVPSSLTGSPPAIGDSPRYVSSTVHGAIGFSRNALPGSAICSGSSSMHTLPSYETFSSSKGVTTSKRMPPASKASLSLISGRPYMNPTEPSGR